MYTIEVIDGPIKYGRIAFRGRDMVDEKVLKWLYKHAAGRFRVINPAKNEHQKAGDLVRNEED